MEQLPFPSHAKTRAADIPLARVRMNRLLIALMTMAIQLVLKRHYSLASADQLIWILAPTARLVAWLTPARPVFESGVGHVDFSQGIIIAPACAGINFMIMALGLAVCCGLVQLKYARGLLGWLILSLAGAYAYTLLVNTLRIALAMNLYQADIYNHWMTPARLHRLAGIILYLTSLYIFFAGMRALALKYALRFDYRPAVKPEWAPSWLPLVWYLGGAAAVPLVNLPFQPRGPLVWEHYVTVVVTGLLTWGAVKLVIKAAAMFYYRNGKPISLKCPQGSERCK